MKDIRISFFRLNILVVVLFSIAAKAQDYVLAVESFENKQDSLWTLNNAKQVEVQSFKGQRAIEVAANGSFSYEINLTEGVKELVVKAAMRLYNSSFKNKPNTFKRATIFIESFSKESKVAISNEEIGFLSTSSDWINFEKEIKIPSTANKIRVICKNSSENATVYFDDVEVEKRQLGFVKVDMPWAKSVGLMKEKARRLIKNGDFEDGGQNWNAYWGFQLSKVAHSGEYACLIQNDNVKDWKGTNNDKAFKIPVGTKKLKVTAWIKADNVISAGNAWETGALLLTFADDFNNEVPGGEAVVRTVGTHDWRKFETYFNVSERATMFNLRPVLAASSGKIYFDDIVAEPLTEEQYIAANSVLKNPGFENLLSGWPTYAGEATMEQAHTGEYALKVSGEAAAWEMRMQNIFLKKGAKAFTFSVWMKTIDVTETPNSWEGARVYIEFKDINGIVLGDAPIGRAVGNTDWQLYSQKVNIPEDAVEITISCGRANVSGKAYFDDAKIEY